jgi:hypothetical protein
MSDLETRFWAKVDTSGDCWTWTAAVNSYGYGVIGSDGKVKKAHRLAYEWTNGPIPDGSLIDHICRNRACVRASHLRLASQKQNQENLEGPNLTNVTSGVRGVYKHRDGKWQARATHNGRNHSGGLYPSIEEADAAAIALRNRLFTHNDADRRDS